MRILFSFRPFSRYHRLSIKIGKWWLWSFSAFFMEFFTFSFWNKTLRTHFVRNFTAYLLKKNDVSVLKRKKVIVKTDRIRTYFTPFRVFEDLCSSNIIVFIKNFCKNLFLNVLFFQKVSVGMLFGIKFVLHRWRSQIFFSCFFLVYTQLFYLYRWILIYSKCVKIFVYKNRFYCRLSDRNFSRI